MERSYSTRSRTASSSALVAAMAVTWLMCPEALLTVRSTLRPALKLSPPEERPQRRVWALERVAIEMFRVFRMFRHPESSQREIPVANSSK